MHRSQEGRSPRRIGSIAIESMRSTLCLHALTQTMSFFKPPSRLLGSDRESEKPSTCVRACVCLYLSTNDHHVSLFLQPTGIRHPKFTTAVHKRSAAPQRKDPYKVKKKSVWRTVYSVRRWGTCLRFFVSMVHDDSLTRSLVDTGSAARSPFLELTRSDPRGGALLMRVLV